MDNSLSNISTLSIGSQANSSMSSDNKIGGDESSPIAKRRPGRPRGSGKKSSDIISPVVKIKRPVGRPRKDGYPAGSVVASRKSKSRKSLPAKLSTNDGPANDMQAPPGALAFPGGYYSYPLGHHPQWQPSFPGAVYAAVAPPISNSGSVRAVGSPQATYSIDPSLERDDWADLARIKPNVFLNTLMASLSAPNPVSSAGPNVEESFKSHLVSLAPNPAQSQPIPSLYSILKTFWLPSSPAYFSLTASASTARTPSEHRFLYWDPQPLVFNGIACPSCSVPLINRGRIRSGPIKVYDLEKPFFIIGCEYVCKSPTCITNASPEGRKFASTDSSILRSLPTRLRDEFPAHLMQGDSDAGSSVNVWNWQAMGVSRSLWNMVRGCLRAGLGRAAILQVVRSIQYGVPDDHDHEHTSPDAVDGNEGVEEPQVQQNVQQDEVAPDTPAQATVTDDDRKDKFTDAYHNAWKANSCATDSNPHATNAEAGPSTSTSDPSISRTPNSGPESAAQSFTVPHNSPYPPPFGYGAYSFFQQQGASQALSADGQDTSEVNPPDQNPNYNVLKRPFAFALEGPGTSDVAILEHAQKRTRHCCKCGSQECKGKGGRSFCMSACQDCGKLDCKGRNSRRPDKRCADAWS